jgi:hypothetical protein
VFRARRKREGKATTAEEINGFDALWANAIVEALSP